MSNIYEKLFELYGDAALQECGCRKRVEITKFADTMQTDDDTKIKVSDYLSESYYRWSTNAFALGIHLGLSLSNDQISGFGPQKGQ